MASNRLETFHIHRSDMKPEVSDVFIRLLEAADKYRHAITKPSPPYVENWREMKRKELETAFNEAVRAAMQEPTHD